MNKTELVQKLEDLKIHPKYYSIGIEVKDNAYNIERIYDGTYAVYFLERGEKNDLHVFNDEEDANDFIYSIFLTHRKYGIDLST